MIFGLQSDVCLEFSWLFVIVMLVVCVLFLLFCGLHRVAMWFSRWLFRAMRKSQPPKL